MPDNLPKEALFQLGQKAVIVNEKNEILMVGQTIAKAGGFCYDFPGGRVNEGEEDLHLALKREVMEELQVEIEIHDLLTISLSKKSKWRKHRIILAAYHCSISSGEPDTSQDEDVEEYKWVHIDKLLDLPGIRYTKETIEEIKQKLDL